MPIQKTGNPNEYVINRDDKTPLGSLSNVKAAASAEAATFCAAMKKQAVEKYSIDKERAVFVWPETTLHFECIDPKVAPTNASAKRDTEESRTNRIYEELLKLDELRRRGVITQAEFDAEKDKLLNRK